MKDPESEDKQLVFDVIQKGEPVEGCREKGQMIRVMGQENNLCSNGDMSRSRLHLSRSEKTRLQKSCFLTGTRLIRLLCGMCTEGRHRLLLRASPGGHHFSWPDIPLHQSLHSNHMQPDL